VALITSYPGNLIRGLRLPAWQAHVSDWSYLELLWLRVDFGAAWPSDEMELPANCRMRDA
jgi:hypothetical protein